MSETQEPAPAVPPGVTVTTKQELGFGGVAQELFIITFGTPSRTIEVAQLSLGDQFDLAEVTGNNSDNASWMNMAFIAASVLKIDGVPRRPGYKRDVLKDTLNRIGIEGMKAAGLVLAGYRGPEAAMSEEAHREVVGG